MAKCIIRLIQQYVKHVLKEPKLVLSSEKYAYFCNIYQLAVQTGQWFRAAGHVSYVIAYFFFCLFGSIGYFLLSKIYWRSVDQKFEMGNNTSDANNFTQKVI
jgi:hypothetical protein